MKGLDDATYECLRGRKSLSGEDTDIGATRRYLTELRNARVGYRDVGKTADKDMDERMVDECVVEFIPLCFEDKEWDSDWANAKDKLTNRMDDVEMSGVDM